MIMKIKYRFMFYISMLALMFSPSAYSELPVQSRELQYIWVKDGYQVGVDNDPPWQWKYLEDTNGGEFVAMSPDSYYPPAAITIRTHNSIEVDRGEHFFKRMALVAINTAMKSYGTDFQFKLSDLEKNEYGGLKGYSVEFLSKSKDVKHDVKIFVARNSINKVLSLTASTLEGKLPHLSPVLDRMWSNISFAQANKYQEK